MTKKNRLKIKKMVYNYSSSMIDFLKEKDEEKRTKQVTEFAEIFVDVLIKFIEEMK